MISAAFYRDALVRKGLEEMRKGRVVRHEQVRTPFITDYAIDKTDIVVLVIYQGAEHWPESF